MTTPASRLITPEQFLRMPWSEGAEFHREALHLSEALAHLLLGAEEGDGAKEAVTVMDARAQANDGH